MNGGRLIRAWYYDQSEPGGPLRSITGAKKNALLCHSTGGRLMI
jgi:hypothetical protein